MRRKNKKGREQQQNKITKLNEHHLTIDQMVARQKLEQLRLLTRTDLAILNSAEPYRVSGYALFKRNLLDPTLHTSVCIVYLLSKLLTRNSNQLSFVVLFIFIFALINHHIESYRSFVIVEKSVNKLSNDYELRKKFLSTHLGYDPRSKRNKQALDDGRIEMHKLEKTSASQSTGQHRQQRRQGHESSRMATALPMVEPETIDEQTKDSFRWINRIIIFFWPYLSHLIHFELNEFFKDKIESGSMARSEEGTKRLFYAIIRQLDTNVLVIEKCQLGAQTPLIRNLSATEGTITPPPDAGKRVAKKTKKPTKSKRMVDLMGLKTVMSDLMSPRSEQQSIGSDEKTNYKQDDHKTLVYNFDLVYNGDMDISVIYRYFCCCSSRVGLKDIFLHFNIQITLGPIRDEMPFIDEVSFTLLELPDFGYKGIALAELTELKIVKKLINRIIRDHLLHPRKVTVSLRELFAKLTNGPSRRPQQQRGLGGPLDNDDRGQASKQDESMSRIEPHPGKIISSSERPVSMTPTTSSNQQQQQQQRNEDHGVSFWTRLQANALICGCMSANFLMRCCQCGGGRAPAASDDTPSSPRSLIGAQNQRTTTMDPPRSPSGPLATSQRPLGSQLE